MTGYESKRAAARDKLLDDDDALTIAYQSGYYDGKKAAAQEQKPMHPQLKAMLEEYFDKCFAESSTQRPWVELTDDEVYKIAFALEGEHWRKIADAIKAKLKDKNT